MVSPWRAEFQPGRVFELKRKTWSGGAVKVLVIRDAAERFYDHPSPYVVEVNESGCLDQLSPHRAKRFNSYALRPVDFSARLVQRRRPDLERFDRADLAMIRYGIPLQFSGRMLRYEYPTSAPMIAGVTWTTFWTYSDTLLYGVSRFDPAIRSAFQGAWHLVGCQEVRDSRGYWIGRDKITTWVTAESRPDRLHHIRRTLSAAFGGVHRGELRCVARDEGDHWSVEQVGCGGPAFTTIQRSRISKRDGVDRWSITSTQDPANA